jgi:hypothetical protein
MVPATVGLLTLAALVFSVGMLSARNAARSRNASGDRRVHQNTNPAGTPSVSNNSSPSPSAMDQAAGGTAPKETLSAVR